MAKTTAKTPAKKPVAKAVRKASATTTADTSVIAAPVNDEAPVAKKRGRPRKNPEATAATAPKAPAAKKAKAAKPKMPKAPTDTRVITMHGETRLTHRGDGADALAALIPAIDAVHAGSKVTITSAAHDGAVVHIHAVPAGHALPYETNPGVVLTIGANGLMAFDHVAIGLATPDSIEEAVLSVMDAVRPVEGEAPGPVGRCTDWHPQALLAAQTLAERLEA